MTFDHCPTLKGIGMPIERVLLMRSSLSSHKPTNHYFSLIPISFSVVAQTDVRYCFIIDQQPIGRLLFRRFCEISQKYQRYNNFLDVMDKYEVLSDIFALLLSRLLIELLSKARGYKKRGNCPRDLQAIPSSRC
jgi:hypothetical protein